MFFVYLLVAFLGSFFSSMSGGGASIINFPIWMSLGFSIPLAATIEKVNAIFWTLPASYNYLKGKKIDWYFLILFTLIGLTGSYLGVLLITRVDQLLLKRLIGIIIIILVGVMYYKKEDGINISSTNSKTKRALSYIVAFPMGIYEGLFGSGNGIIFSFLTIKTRGFDLILALGYYFAIAFFWVAFALFFLSKQGYFDASISIPAVIGSICGSYLGSRIANKQGNRFIKQLFIVVGAILGLKMLINF